MLVLYLTFLDDEHDKSLFEKIYISHRKQMALLAMSLLKDESDAEDVVADVFLRIAQRNFDVIRAIKNDTDLRNYLLKATKNASLNKIKSRKRENISLDAIAEYDMSGIEDLSDDTFIDEVCTRFEYESVVKAIRLLSEKYRDAMYLHYVMELTVPETAKALNQKKSATKQQLVRGKKMLLGLLRTKGDEKNGNGLC